MFIIYYLINYLQEKNGTELVESYHTSGWSQQEANQTMVHKGKSGDLKGVRDSVHSSVRANNHSPVQGKGWVLWI